MVFFHHKRHFPKKGFSLIEVLVAMFIFSLVMVAVSQVFGSTTLNHREAKKIQQNLEDAELALNTIAKVLRTSTVTSPALSGDTQSITVEDHSQSNRSIVYAISGGKLTSDGVQMLNADVSGSFSVVPSEVIDSGSGAGRIGKVTISLVVGVGSSQSQTLQTTVSLRDYNYAGL